MPSFYSNLRDAIQHLEGPNPEHRTSQKYIFDCYKSNLSSYVTGLMAQRPSLVLVPRSENADCDCEWFDQSAIISQATQHATRDFSRMNEGVYPSDVHMYAHLLHTGFFSGFDFERVYQQQTWNEYHSFPPTKLTRQFIAVSATIWMIASIASSATFVARDGRDQNKQPDQRDFWRVFGKLCATKSSHREAGSQNESNAAFLTPDFRPLSLPEMFFLSNDLERGENDAISDIELHCFLVMLECAEVLYTLQRYATTFGCAPAASNKRNLFLKSMIEDAIRTQFLDRSILLQIDKLDEFMQLLIKQHEGLLTGNRAYPSKVELGAKFQKIRKHEPAESVFNCIREIARKARDRTNVAHVDEWIRALKVWIGATVRQ